MRAMQLLPGRAIAVLLTVIAGALPIDRGAVAAIVVSQRNTLQEIAFTDSSAFSDALLSHT